MRCPCPPAAEQPWRTRDTWSSPASLVGTALLIAFAVLALVAGVHPAVGGVIIGVLVAFVVGAAIVEARRGHRGWCLARRASWFGLALPGVPLRVIASLA